ncbi:MAG TPA: hypothetical protein VK569_05100, partial [Bacteroidota bacterium]|nr:hypothetical protein [Bacteroidota bacterium]
ILIMSCAPSQSVVSFWKNPDSTLVKKYSSVFIIAVTADRGARNIVEGDLAAAAEARGMKAIRSIDASPESFSNDKLPSKEEMFAKIKELKCEAVFTVSLLDTKSSQRYIPGTTMYGVAGYGSAGYAPYPVYGYYGNYSAYVTYAYPVATTPGYYAEDKTYFIEGNLFDAESGKIRWSMQSTAYNPKTLYDFSKEYTQLLASELAKQKR